MKLDEIKAGETYNVRVKVTQVDYYKNVRVDTVDENGKRLGVESTVFYTGELRAFSPIITETDPKYDPCRKFRKGDKVRMVKWHGRSFFDGGCHPNCNKWTVTEDETRGVNLEQDGHTITDVPACFIELVTPVEELEPYSVETGGYNRFRIKKGNLEYSYFPFGEHCVLSMDEAKAAAEAECARLNAEYRKEQK